MADSGDSVDEPDFDFMAAFLGPVTARLLRASFQGPRETLATDRTQGLVVDTSDTVDEGWETAVIDRWGTYPVERYPDKEAAAAGHARWVALASDDLVAVDELGPTEAPELGKYVVLEPYPVWS